MHSAQPLLLHFACNGFISFCRIPLCQIVSGVLMLRMLKPGALSRLTGTLAELRAGWLWKRSIVIWTGVTRQAMTNLIMRKKKEKYRGLFFRLHTFLDQVFLHLLVFETIITIRRTWFKLMCTNEPKQPTRFFLAVDISALSEVWLITLITTVFHLDAPLSW